VIDERLKVVWASVAVINIRGVLLDSAAENWLAALDEGVLAVERLHHYDLAKVILDDVRR